MAVKTPVVDHLNNKYPSITAMCKHYGITSSLYHSRIKSGKSIEYALTTSVTRNPPNSKTITDHKGNTFKSVSAMCKYWNMTRVTYNARIRAG